MRPPALPPPARIYRKFQEPRANTPVPSAPDPYSEDMSGAGEYLGMLQENVQEDCSGEEEIDVENALKAGGREGEGVTRGHESRVRETRRKISGLKR